MAGTRTRGGARERRPAGTVRRPSSTGSTGSGSSSSSSREQATLCPHQACRGGFVPKKQCSAPGSAQTERPSLTQPQCNRNPDPPAGTCACCRPHLVLRTAGQQAFCTPPPPPPPPSCAHQVGREGLALAVPERVHEYFVVLDGDGAHGGVCAADQRINQCIDEPTCAGRSGVGRRAPGAGCTTDKVGPPAGANIDRSSAAIKSSL